MKLSRTGSNQKIYQRLAVMNWLAIAGVVLAALVLIFTLWLTGVRVGDTGMAPMLQQGDVLLLDRLSKYVRAPRRGDIVAYRAEDGSALCLGRIIGLPGETVQQRDGRVYINGSLLLTEYLVEGGGDLPLTQVESACYFIMPDDRTSMTGSAYDMLIPVERIAGKVILRVAPLPRLGIFTS